MAISNLRHVVTPTPSCETGNHKSQMAIPKPEVLVQVQCPAHASYWVCGHGRNEIATARQPFWGRSENFKRANADTNWSNRKPLIQYGDDQTGSANISAFWQYEKNCHGNPTICESYSVSVFGSKNGRLPTQFCSILAIRDISTSGLVARHLGSPASISVC